LRRRRIPMSQEGRRRAAQRKARLVRAGKLGVMVIFAVCAVLIVRQL
jgi:hypothetical protein